MGITFGSVIVVWSVLVCDEVAQPSEGSFYLLHRLPSVPLPSALGLLCLSHTWPSHTQSSYSDEMLCHGATIQEGGGRCEQAPPDHTE